MPTLENNNSPIFEAQRAEQVMYSYINTAQSFIMEAGAGAGKTYSLKKALNYSLEIYRKSLIEHGQHIACITFTEAATRELANEVDNHPLVVVSTIHSFCWSILKDFQSTVREVLPRIDKWRTYLEEQEINEQVITYDVGYRSIDEEKISLHHDDIPLLMSHFLENSKFQKVFISRFPILYIDEYQDTQEDLMSSIIGNLMSNSNIQLGLFGDSWQMIYDGVCGHINSPVFQVIKKHANFRSDKKIVDVLNRIRPDLTQIPSNNSPETSSVAVYLTNKWTGDRGSGPHKEGSLPDAVAHNYYDQLKRQLESEGWDFSNSRKTKVLMLTNTVLAKEQGYSDLLNQFPYPRTDQLMNAEHKYIKLFVEKIEPVCRAYEQEKYGDMFSTLGQKSRIKNHADKESWYIYLEELQRLRAQGSIGDVVDYVMSERKRRIGVSDGFVKYEELFKSYSNDPTIVGDDEDLKKRYERLSSLRTIPYAQISSFYDYINEQTPFSTNHKVKGLQYDDVLVLVSQSWNKYNFKKMLECAYEDNTQETNKKFFIQNRNLFYVTCSRSKKRLVLLFVRELSTEAISTLNDWFGSMNVEELHA